MCDPKIIKKIDNGEAIVVAKTRLAIWIVSLIIAVTVAFTTVQLQAASNAKRILKIETKQKAMYEVQFNLRKICEHFKIEYTEIKE